MACAEQVTRWERPVKCTFNNYLNLKAHGKKKKKLELAVGEYDLEGYKEKKV